MKTLLVTGCAGFIASKVCEQLLAAGDQVVGIDNLNDYYDVSLKQHRLEQLRQHPAFTFAQLDIEDRAAVAKVFDSGTFSAVLNLAARAGVRYSMKNPFVYMTTNAMGSLNLMEEMRQRGIHKIRAGLDVLAICGTADAL